MNKYIHELSEWFSLPIVRLGNYRLDLGDLVFIAISLVFLFYLSEIFRRWLTGSLLGRFKIDLGIRQSIGLLMKYGMLALGFLVILHSVGIELTAIGVVVGTLGVGLGIGLQNIANNFASGLVILVERPIRVGDRVTVGKLSGDITEIRSRATKVVTNDNIAVIVPNSVFTSQQVTNWSYNGGASRFNLPIRVCIDEDPEQVRRLLLEVLRAEPGVLKIPAPDVLLESFNEGAITLNMRIWSTQFTHKPPVLRNRIYSAAARKLREHRIKVPYQQADFHVKIEGLDVQDD